MKYFEFSFQKLHFLRPEGVKENLFIQHSLIDDITFEFKAMHCEGEKTQEKLDVVNLTKC